MLRSLCCAPQPALNTRPSISARPASVIERRLIPEQEEKWEQLMVGRREDGKGPEEPPGDLSLPAGSKEPTCEQRFIRSGILGSFEKDAKCDFFAIQRVRGQFAKTSSKC